MFLDEFGARGPNSFSFVLASLLACSKVGLPYLYHRNRKKEGGTDTGFVHVSRSMVILYSPEVLSRISFQKGKAKKT